MPPPIRVRTSFLNDIAFLRRLQKSIEADQKRSPTFCRKASRRVQGLILVLEEQRVREEKARFEKVAS